MDRQSYVTTLHASAAETVDKNSYAVHVGGYSEAVAYLDVTAEIDSSSTLDIKFQSSPDGTTWYDLASGAFAQVTGVSKALLKLPAIFGEYMRAVYDINDTNNAKATATLSASGQPTAGKTVTIGSGLTARTYTFVSSLTAPDQVFIGVSAAVTLDNLKSAINASAGAGTAYSNGTVANALVSATTNTDTTQVIEALLAGTAGNSIAALEDSTSLSFDHATLTGGTNMGMTFDLTLALKT